MISGFAGEFPDRVRVECYAQPWPFWRRQVAPGDRNRILHNVAQVTEGAETFARIRQIWSRDAQVRAGSSANSHFGLTADDARDMDFGVKTGVVLASRFGGSNYAAFRRYVITHTGACCVVVLEPSIAHVDGGFSAAVRRVVMNKSFEKIYDGKALCVTVRGSHPLVSVMPKKRMSFGREIVLIDRNGDERICTAEGFKTGPQTLILIRDEGLRKRSGIIVSAKFKALGK